MADIATAIQTAMERAVDSVVDGIAEDGLLALRRVVHEAGFTRSEYLRDFEVLAHISGRRIEFEILLDVEAVLPEDEETRKALEEQQARLEEAERKASRTLRIRRGNIQKVRPARDARTPARDARKPARDARKTAQDRLVEHELARIAPRSARMTRTGKLAVALSRSIRETKTEVVFPEGKFQGILGDFMDELEKVVFERFVPELRDIVETYGT